MKTTASSIIQFDIPPGLVCAEPTEKRNLRRDDVRLLVTNRFGKTQHSTFEHFSSFLKRGDVLVVNTSATVPAALPVLLPGNKQGRLHLSTKLTGEKWLWKSGRSPAIKPPAGIMAGKA